MDLIFSAGTATASKASPGHEPVHVHMHEFEFRAGGDGAAAA